MHAGERVRFTVTGAEPGDERVRWTSGAKADVIVFGEGRGIAVVRVKRHWRALWRGRRLAP